MIVNRQGRHLGGLHNIMLVLLCPFHRRDLVGKMKAPGEDPKDSCQQLRRRLKQLKRTAKTFDDSATQARVNLNNFENRSVLRRRRVMDLKKAIKGQEERIQKLTEKLRAVPNDIVSHFSVLFLLLSLIHHHHPSSQ